MIGVVADDPTLATVPVSESLTAVMAFIRQQADAFIAQRGGRT